MGLQPAARQIVSCDPRPHLWIVFLLYKYYNNLDIIPLLLFFQLRSSNQSTITGVAHCHKKAGDELSRACLFVVLHCVLVCIEQVIANGIKRWQQPLAVRLQCTLFLSDKEQEVFI